MTLDEARSHVGRPVVYRAPRSMHRLPGHGVITSVNDTYVFVRYGTDSGSQATRPEDLELLAPTA